MRRKGKLTIEQHEQFAVQINACEAFMSATYHALSERYGTTSRQARLANVALRKCQALKSALEDRAFMDHPYDEVPPHLYYGRSEGK